MAPAALRVGVVGAGAAGLCAARHCLANGMACTVFEQSGDIGGTWQYSECVGKDEYGIPIHTSMYPNLRTNLPKEVIQFPELDYKQTESYLTSQEILQYLKDYVELFNVRSVCKFYHHVKRISHEDGKWRVTVMDLPNHKEDTYTFDALCICNGLNNKPNYPKLEGIDEFQGMVVHSHDYRTPEVFTGQNVLLIGGGLSALDLCDHISKCSAKIFLSHHVEKNFVLPEKVIQKPDVARLTHDTVEFKDGSAEKVDAVVYCTGFKCNYSFMDESCGIREDEGLVYPLYKYFINANNPTMCIIGNLFLCMQLPTFDIQIRFFIKTLKDSSILPSRDEMIQDVDELIKKKVEDPKVPKRVYFKTNAVEDAEYYYGLAKMAGIEPVSMVLIDIFARAVSRCFGDFLDYRDDIYKIIDNQTYTVLPA